MIKITFTSLLVALALACTVSAQGGYNPRKGQPVLVKPGQLAKLTWKPTPPHPDVVMCCGGGLQLSWSPMEGGVVSSVVLYSDTTCPASLANQENVVYIVQAANKGIVTLDFKQNGDYYISSSVGEHCATNGMQFLLAVRGCPQDSPTYTPTIPINVQCQAQLGQQGLAGAAGVLNNTALPGQMGAAGALGAAGAAGPAARTRSSAGAGRAVGVLAAALGGAAAAAAVLL